MNRTFVLFVILAALCAALFAGCGSGSDIIAPSTKSDQAVASAPTSQPDVPLANARIRLTLCEYLVSAKAIGKELPAPSIPTVAPDGSGSHVNYETVADSHFAPKLVFEGRGYETPNRRIDYHISRMGEGPYGLSLNNSFHTYWRGKAEGIFRVWVTLAGSDEPVATVYLKIVPNPHRPKLVIGYTILNGSDPDESTLRVLVTNSNFDSVAHEVTVAASVIEAGNIGIYVEDNVANAVETTVPSPWPGQHATIISSQEMVQRAREWVATFDSPEVVTVGDIAGGDVKCVDFRIRHM